MGGKIEDPVIKKVVSDNQKPRTENGQPAYGKVKKQKKGGRN